MNVLPSRRAVTASAVVLALGLTALIAVPAHADEPITLEGEAYTTTDMVPGSLAQTGASGGQSLQLYAAQDAPASGYIASYDVTAPATSLYRLETTTIPVGVAWASPFEFRVNAEEWQDTSGARELGIVTSELRTYDLGTVRLDSGTNSVSFRVDERRSAPNTNYAFFLDAFTLIPVDVELRSVAAPDRFGVFEAGEDVQLEAALNAAAPASTTVAWSVTDYGGTVVTTGESIAATGSAHASIGLGTALPTGAYRLDAHLVGDDRIVSGSFAVLPDAGARIPVDDSPFAVDVYGSKLIATEDAESFAHVLRLTGVDWIRDRQRWNDAINPAPGTIDFSGEQQPRAWLEAADAAGLRTLSSFHDGPAWTRTDDRELPQDLRDMYSFALAAGEDYDGLVDAWQLWNEQNRKFALESEGADRYASVMKAAALGFLDSGTDARLIGGGLAGTDPHYAQWQFRNGILDYTDGYAYHTHTTVNSSATVNAHPDFSSQIEAAAPFGGGSKQRWVTESGIALNSADPTQLPTAEQERLQARYIVSSAAESLAQGSTKHFFFIAAPYREGASYWSMYRTPDEPMAALAAQSIMTDQLGEGRFTGRLADLPAGVSGYVFETGAGPTAVLWAGAATDVSVPVAGAAESTDLMGGDLDVDVVGGEASLTVGPDPVYLSADDFTELVDAPVSETAAPAVTAADFDAAERVIVQQVFDDATSADSQTHGYGLLTDAANSLTIELYNFNDHAVTAAVEATAEGGWEVSAGAAPVTIAAGDRAEVPLTVSAGPDLTQSLSDLTVVAEVDGVESSPSVTELRPRVADLTSSHVIDGPADLVEVTYTNRSDLEQHITESSWSFDDQTSGRDEDIVVAPGEIATLRSPAAPAGGTDVDYTASVRIVGHGELATRGTLSVLPREDVPHLSQKTIEVDGLRDDLDGVPLQQLAAPGVDPTSLAATAWFTWDEEHLFLTAEVADDVSLQPFVGNATWQADGLQFAVAPTWPGESDLRPEIQPRIEFGFALTTDGPQLYRYASGTVGGFLTDADAAAVRDETTGITTYEVAVPWTLLEPIGVTPSSAASLSIVANDTDGDGTRGWVQWGGGITTAKDSELFEPVVFATDPHASGSGSTANDARCVSAIPRSVDCG